MSRTTINPLCDKDHAEMSFIEVAGEAQTPYVCYEKNCLRRYSETAGYFDLVGGKPNLETDQILCLGDARPLYLEEVSVEGYKIWRCPWCNEFVKK